MSDLDKLREALKRFTTAVEAAKWDPRIDKGFRESIGDYELLIAAARDYLALLESDAIVIKRDTEGRWWDLNESAILETERFTQDDPSPSVTLILARFFDAMERLADSSKAPE